MQKAKRQCICGISEEGRRVNIDKGILKQRKDRCRKMQLFQVNAEIYDEDSMLGRETSYLTLIMR